MGFSLFYAKFASRIMKRLLAQVEERSTGLKSRINGMRMQLSRPAQSLLYIFLKGSINHAN